jgi:putative nucleotidyltransferase with HDIG domain
MQFELAQLSSRVTRRTLLTLLGCGLVPVLAVGVTAYHALSTSLIGSASTQLAAEADAHAALVTDRIDRLATVLHGPIDSVPLGNNGIPVRNLASRAHFDAVLLESAQDRVARTLGTMPARPDLNDAQSESLRHGRPVLFTGMENKHNTVFLVVPTGKEGSEFPRVWGHATVASAFGDLDDGSAHKDFCLYVEAAPIYCRADADAVPLGHDSGATAGVMTWRVNGSTMLSGYRRLGGTRGFGGTPWYLVMSVPQPAVLAPLAPMRTAITFGLVIAALALAGLSHLLTRRRVTPLVALTNAVEQVRAGDYTTRVAATSNDEFEALTDGFNQMAVELDRRISTFDTMHRVDLALLEQHTAAAVSGTVSESVPALLNATAVAVVTARRYDPLRWCGEVMRPDRLPERIDVMVTRSVVPALRQTPDWFIVAAGEPLPDYCAALNPQPGSSVVVFPMVQFGRPFGVLAVALRPDVAPTPRILASARQIATQLALGMANAVRLEELESVSSGAMVALARAIDAGSQWTERHSERVADLAVSMAKHVGLDEKSQLLLRRAALVHDIGKLRLPRALLDRAGELSDAESRAIQSHTILGAEMLLSIPAFRDVMPLVQQHHELLDGSGYPNGLKAEKISPVVRILTVADVYDALVSDRPYREGLTPEGALGILRRGAGIKFDERVVGALAEIVQTSSGGAPAPTDEALEIEAVIAAVQQAG